MARVSPIPYAARMSEHNRTEFLAQLGPPDRTGRRMLSISCFVLLVVSLGWTAVCAGLVMMGSLLIDPLLAIVSGVAAVGLGLPYLFVILWLDRNEQEPPLLLLSALGWGAFVATMVSGIFNDIFGAIALSAVGDPALARQLTASLSAPFVEELAKGLALVALYVMFRHHLDNVLDGVIYGALVGLGFAVFENFTYYMNQGNLGGAIGLICLRGFITSPGTHACFTGILGASIGLFRVQRAGVVRWMFPVIGLGLAMLIHFSWNTFTQFFIFDDGPAGVLIGIPMAVVVLQAPFVVLVLVVSILALWHETRLILRYLGTEKPPVLHESELGRLVPARRRTLYTAGLLLTGRIGDWLLVRKRNRRLVELAFEKWHMDQEAELGASEAREHALRVTALRRELSALPAPPA